MYESGGVNLLFKRARLHRQEVVEEALRTISALAIDHMVVTGDLTNLALDPEFALVRELLTRYERDLRRLSVLPGTVRLHKTTASPLAPMDKRGFCMPSRVSIPSK